MSIRYTAEAECIICESHHQESSAIGDGLGRRNT